MRNRLLMLLLLPAIVLIWILGWSLYWLGDQPKNSRTQKRTGERKPENAHFMVNVPQEQEVLK